MGRGSYTAIHSVLVHVALLMVFTAPQAVFAEDGQDRRQDYENSRDEARKGNQQKLMPNMMMHLSKAQQLLRESQEARQQKDEGRAQQKEEEAMMEQMKAQQLQQQMGANENSAQQNEAAAQKLRESPDPAGRQEKIKETPVISLRIETAQRKPGDPESESMAESSSTPVPKTELVDLAGVTMPIKEWFSAPPQESGTSAAAASGTTSNDRVAIRYDESANGEGKTPTPSSTTTSTSSTTTSPASGAAASMAGGVVASSSGGSGSSGGGGGAGGDFWGAVGSMVDESNAAITTAENKLNLKSLRGDGDGESGEKKDKLPGAELPDEAFWKKVGKEPVQCKVAGKSARETRQRQQCLKSARRDLERKWRDKQPKRTIASK